MPNQDWINYWIKDPFQGGIDYITHYGLRCLPVEMVSSTGKHLGILAGRYRFPEINQHIIHNLKTINPGLADHELPVLANHMWGNIGMTLAEMSIADRIDEYRVEVINKEYLTDNSRPGTPIIFLFAHLGNWEILTKSARNLGYELHVVYEWLDNRFQRNIAYNARVRLDYKQIPPTYGGVRKLYKILENGDNICLAIDEFKDNIVLSPAFGRKITWHTNIEFAVRLAKKFQAMIIPAYCLRKEGVNFSIHLNPPVLPDRYNAGDDKDKEIISCINELYETCIRQHIDQWYMLHRIRFTVK